jgi:hypothetical protein
MSQSFLVHPTLHPPTKTSHFLCPNCLNHRLLHTLRAKGRGRGKQRHVFSQETTAKAPSKGGAGEEKGRRTRRRIDTRGTYTGRFLGKEALEEKRGANHALLSDRHQVEKLSEAADDLLRTSIAMDYNGVKAPAPAQSPPSERVSAVESGNGIGRQLWTHSSQRLARAAAGAEGRDAATTAAGMVLSS